jgi:hypothetical protein
MVWAIFRRFFEHLEPNKSWKSTIWHYFPQKYLSLAWKDPLPFRREIGDPPTLWHMWSEIDKARPPLFRPMALTWSCIFSEVIASSLLDFAATSLLREWSSSRRRSWTRPPPSGWRRVWGVCWVWRCASEKIELPTTTFEKAGWGSAVQIFPLVGPCPLNQKIGFCRFW